MESDDMKEHILFTRFPDRKDLYPWSVIRNQSTLNSKFLINLHTPSPSRQFQIIS